MWLDKKDAKLLEKGALVRASGFRRPFTVVDGPDKRGYYTVALGDMRLSLPESKLELYSPKKKEKKSTPSSIPDVPTIDTLSIDLHGLKAADAQAKLEQIIDQALLKNAQHIEIIHGIGRGTLRHTVEKYLSSCKHIQSFHPTPNNPGSTLAHL